MWTWWMDRVGASAKPWHFFPVIKHHLSPKMRMWKLFTSNFISKTRDRILSVCVCLGAPCVFEWYEASLSSSAKDMEHSQHIKRMPVTFFCPILRETFSEGCGPKVICKLVSVYWVNDSNSSIVTRVMWKQRDCCTAAVMDKLSGYHVDEEKLPNLITYSRDCQEASTQEGDAAWGNPDVFLLVPSKSYLFCLRWKLRAGEESTLNAVCTTSTTAVAVTRL